MTSQSKDWLLLDYTEYARQVVAFNNINEVVTTENIKTKINFQKVLIAEEFRELVEAYEERDKTNFLKELCDLFVVTSYMQYLEHGECIYEGSAFINNGGRVGTISSTFASLSDWIYLEDYLMVLKTVIGLLNKLDVDDQKALSLVNENNFSKYPIYSQLCEGEYDAEVKEIELRGSGRYLGVNWCVSNCRVIFRDCFGKVMKPIGYKSVDVSICIN